MAVSGPESTEIRAFALVIAVSAVVVELARLPDPIARVARSCEVGAICAFVVVSVSGLVTLAGPADLWICLLFLVTCPAAAAAYPVWVRRMTGDAGPPARRPPPSPFLHADGPLPLLTTAELCAAWQRSSTVLSELRESGTALAQSRVVATRQEYLDELELRHPDGFARWLRRGADGGGVSRCYLSHR